jgi:hypothetical protein
MKDEGSLSCDCKIRNFGHICASPVESAELLAELHRCCLLAFSEANRVSVVEEIYLIFACISAVNHSDGSVLRW